MGFVMIRCVQTGLEAAEVPTMVMVLPMLEDIKQRLR